MPQEWATGNCWHARYETPINFLACASVGLVAGYLGYCLGLVLTPNPLVWITLGALFIGFALGLFFSPQHGLKAAGLIWAAIFAWIALISGDFSIPEDIPPGIITSTFIAAPIAAGSAAAFVLVRAASFALSLFRRGLAKSAHPLSEARP